MEISLAENIRKLRKNRKLTQEQLAEALGVTIGAVSKWELGASVPDISLIVDIALFFEVSVDVLLGYGWHKGTMGQTAERIRNLYEERNFAEGMRFAEQALQKYPNSFEVVYQCAELYFMMLSKDSARRAILLYQRSCELIDQNTDPQIGIPTIRDKIAQCYLVLEQYVEAVSALKENNLGGKNDDLIGFTLAANCRRPEEAIPYLSRSLLQCYASLLRTCLGFANAYSILGKPEEALEILQWFLELEEGLKSPEAVTYLDKCDAVLYVACAEMVFQLGDTAAAKNYLRQAKSVALRFDAAPEYRTEHLKYYQDTKSAALFDDMGSSAMEGIEKCMREEENGQAILPMWEEICHEESDKL